MNDLLLRALRCEPVERPPVWLMRQAGRSLPDYQALRKKHSFHELIHTPALAAQVTQLPIDLLGVDAAILFSDILVIAEVFGFHMNYSDEEGMRLLEPSHDIQKNVAGTLSFVANTIRILKKNLTVPLIGFCGGPYTVAKYMKRVTPEWLEKITQATIDYLYLQIEAGVDVIQIFDSWAGTLEPDDFRTLALPYLKTIIDAVKIPTIIFCRGSCRFVSELISLESSAISFDWEKEMPHLRREVPPHIAIQGNLDPAILKGPLPLLQEKATSLLDSMKGSPGFIFNLGHGVKPDTPIENISWLVKKIIHS